LSKLTAVYHIEQRAAASACRFKVGYTSESYKYCVSEDLILWARKNNLRYYEFGRQDLDNISSNEPILLFAEGIELSPWGYKSGRFNRSYSPKELRQKFPNAKIVILMTDAQYNFRRTQPNGKHDGEIGWVLRGLDPSDFNAADMLLFSDHGVMMTYRSITKTLCEYFMWTIAESTITKLTTNKHLYSNTIKTIDFFALINLVSYGQIRRRIRQHLLKSHYKVFFAGNTLSTFDNFQQLYKVYNRSRFILGTTSSVIPTREERCMKGFRDWLAPFCNSVLIYDDYHDVMTYFVDDSGVVVPIYSFRKLATINGLYNDLTSDKELYSSFIDRQRNWALKNTVYQQFTRLFQRWL